MSEALAQLASSPALYPQKLDLIQDGVLLIRMSEDAYRRASFLDDRILTPDMQGLGVPFGAVAKAMAVPTAERPLHFIFHSGHVGSTLFARLLEDTGRTLALKEPLPLRTLAEASDVDGRPDAFLSPLQLAERFGVFLSLWSRGFVSTQAVVLKATSSAARVAPLLLTAKARARCVYLNLPAEPYLATLLAGPNSPADLRGHGPERIRRLGKFLGEAPKPLYALSLGELAASSWLAERLTEQRVVTGFGARVLRLDFEAMLGNPADAIANVARHFGLSVDARTLANVPNSPTLSRYSKAPEHGYSRALRTQVLDQARRDHAQEIRKGLAFLEEAGKRHADVAAVL